MFPCSVRWLCSLHVGSRNHVREVCPSKGSRLAEKL
ncbi:unnamed protein product [Chondrus crispus]|uniref:Uncharacterized protein n=1 Tax=Chondrus crispus TaxID=2769 RepID=R7Q6B1_CHOCR|nr:unnamed protein product [Chondrus crispus]CDF33549.1 unnamed protein product [Chondrus crispus]|eukprot:XP_005713352.1 unnamed protein product [Chondrus crispus]